MTQFNLLALLKQNKLANLRIRLGMIPTEKAHFGKIHCVEEKLRKLRKK